MIEALKHEAPVLFRNADARVSHGEYVEVSTGASSHRHHAIVGCGFNRIADKAFHGCVKDEIRDVDFRAFIEFGRQVQKPALLRHLAACVVQHGLSETREVNPAPLFPIGRKGVFQRFQQQGCHAAYFRSLFRVHLDQLCCGFQQAGYHLTFFNMAPLHDAIDLHLQTAEVLNLPE